MRFGAVYQAGYHGVDPDAMDMSWICAARSWLRWGSLDMTDAKVEASRSAGVTRVFVGSGALDLNERLDELSVFAERFKFR